MRNEHSQREMWAGALHLYNPRIEIHDGGVTPMSPDYTTHWRTLPWLMTAQIMDGPQRVCLGDGREMTAFKGDVVCIAPGILHCSDNLSCHVNHSRWSHINCFLFGAVDITDLMDFPLLLQGVVAARIGDINEDLARTSKDGDLSLLLRRTALAMELVSLCLSQAIPKVSLAQSGELVRLAPVLHYIEANLHSPLSREELARQAHLSPSRFGAVFSAALGMAPGAYIQKLQIQRAQSLLVNTDASIKEIAQKCGHGDAFHFSRLFKHHCGLSPAFYRKSVRQSFRRTKT